MGKQKPDIPRKLSELPYLAAGLEDYALGLRLGADSGRNMRQSVCFMHDALEFLFYQVLLARDVDIYTSGQNTIGFDAAINECRKFGVSLPLIEAIRAIQKHRGDAKHHAQTPHADAFDRFTPAFRILFSIIAFENFGQVLSGELTRRLMPFHLALYELHRRARGHDWEKALVFGLRAFVHKRRAIYGSSDDFATHLVRKPEDLIGVLKATASPSATREEKQSVDLLAASLRQGFLVGQIKEVAEEVSRAFSSMDFIAPTIFDIKTAQRLTERLYRPRSLAIGGMWGGSFGGVREILRGAPALSKSFGAPHYMEDDDRYWTWWDFVVFDGAKWHSFHMEEDFSIKLEMSLEEDAQKRELDLEQVIVGEFAKAAAESKAKG